jgi:hypothetical protein
VVIGIGVDVDAAVDIDVDVDRANRGINSSVYRPSWPLHLNSSFPLSSHVITYLFLKVIDTLDLPSSYIDISLVLPKSSVYHTLLKVTSLCEVYSSIVPTLITSDLLLLATKTGSGLSQCLSVLKSDLIPLKCLVAPESSIN